MRRGILAVAFAILLAGCHNPDAFVLDPSTVDGVLAIELSATTLPADGIARATIVATIDPRTDADKRAVTFTTSAGTLIGGGKEGSTTTVTADASGTAVAELRSATAAGSARVNVAVGSVSRTALVEFTAADPSRIISLELGSSLAPADGASAVAVVARLAAGLTPERRRVTFRTTVGRFLPGNQDSLTTDADSGNVARATLVSTAVGLAQVTAATADGVSAGAAVTFATSLPESLFVSPAAATVRAGGNMRVAVTLLRATGSVTPRLEVVYSATTSTGAAIGVFSGVTLVNENGVSEATFNVPGNATYVGPVTIRAAVRSTVGTATIEIVP